jgi:putative endonuclease
MPTLHAERHSKFPSRDTGSSRRETEELLAPTHDVAFYVYITGEGPDAALVVGSTGNLAAVAPLRLLWFERLDDIPAARALAQRIDGWPRAWKLQMIARTNPDWRDLAGG